MTRLFGTDGIRGRTNVFPMDCETALRVGRAAGLLARDMGQDRIVIGKDTRISGDMLEAALAAGAASVGVSAGLAGVIPTPGVAYLAACLKGVGAGVMISASHNPFYDNGIKIFQRGGLKLTDEQEQALEANICDPENVPRNNVGKISIISDGYERYVRFLLDKFPFRKLSPRIRLVVDASNGAASEICHQVFNDQLFDAVFIHDRPDGFNINRDCGSQHVSDLQKQVKARKADIGLAFDGDADRMIAVDETGEVITGDRILAICARQAKEKKQLKNNCVVSTVMSNIGLTRALDELGIRHVRTGVGDRRVLAEMQRSGAVMGGEDSGHMIFLEDHTTGDGMLSALRLITVMAETGRSLSNLAAVMKVFPQVLKNVEVDASRPDVMQVPEIARVIEDVTSRLGDKGRVLVRYSGTQPLLRVMVEGPEKEMTQAACDQICQVIHDHNKAS
ncbi:MAG: phosphoglucosamine mutase [Desulfotignum sp.]|nr:phosphoglucosamine mutase [Desulfotignum sp.]